MTEAELINLMCVGTTTRPHQLKVLYMGEHYALVHWAGSTYWSGRQYHPATYLRVPVKSFLHGSDYYFHKLAQGRQDKKGLELLIAEVKQANREEPERLRKLQEAQQAADAAMEARVARVQADIDLIVAQYPARQWPDKITSARCVHGGVNVDVVGGIDMNLYGFHVVVQVHESRVTVVASRICRDVDAALHALKQLSGTEAPCQKKES